MERCWHIGRRRRHRWAWTSRRARGSRCLRRVGTPSDSSPWRRRSSHTPRGCQRWCTPRHTCWRSPQCIWSSRTRLARRGLGLFLCPLNCTFPLRSLLSLLILIHSFFLLFLCLQNNPLYDSFQALICIWVCENTFKWSWRCQQ